MAAYHASQCGFCTPGMVASLFSQLHNAEGGQATDRKELGQALDGNICRWGRGGHCHDHHMSGGRLPS